MAKYYAVGQEFFPTAIDHRHEISADKVTYPGCEFFQASYMVHPKVHPKIPISDEALIEYALSLSSIYIFRTETEAKQFAEIFKTDTCYNKNYSDEARNNRHFILQAKPVLEIDINDGIELVFKMHKIAYRTRLNHPYCFTACKMLNNEAISFNTISLVVNNKKYLTQFDKHEAHKKPF